MHRRARLYHVTAALIDRDAQVLALFVARCDRVVESGPPTAEADCRMATSGFERDAIEMLPAEVLTTRTDGQQPGFAYARPQARERANQRTLGSRQVAAVLGDLGWIDDHGVEGARERWVIELAEHVGGERLDAI